MPPLALTSEDGPDGARVELSTPGGGTQVAVLAEVSVAGPAGPTGPAGPAGPTGPIGPTGPGGGGSSKGAIHETFSGGTAVAITAANTNANLGDLAWNVSTSGVQVAASISKLPGEVGAVGIYRIQAGQTNGAQNAVFLGGTTTPIFNVANWFDCTWRVRVDSVVNLQKVQEWGCQSQSTSFMGLLESAGFIAKLTGPTSSLNYQTVTSHLGANSFKDTLVPVDAAFHDFRLHLVSPTQIDFYIDGVLRTTHSVALGDNIPTGALLPVARAISNGAASTGFIDLDDFIFTPIF